jgi:hypothetical protein
VLSESSYLTAIYSYTGAACAIMFIMALWLGRTWRASWAAFAVLSIGALLLTPAFPNANVVTYAPALLVVVFEGLTHGPEAAAHAIKPLAVTTALAVVLAILLRLIVFRRRGVTTPEPQDKEEADAHGE